MIARVCSVHTRAIESLFTYEETSILCRKRALLKAVSGLVTRLVRIITKSMLYTQKLTYDGNQSIFIVCEVAMCCVKKGSIYLPFS